MGTLTTRRVSQNSHDWKYFLDSESEKKRILLISDLHLDNPKCNRKLLKKHLRQAQETEASVMMFGDIFCAMQGVKDRRGSKSQLKASQLEGPYFDNIVEEAAEFFLPFVDVIDFMSYGNHETAIIRHNEIDLLKALKLRLDQAKENRELMLGGYGGWIRLMMTTNNHRRQSIRLKYFHGSGGNSPVTKGAIQQQRAAATFAADILVMGHNHQRQATVFPREVLSDSGKIKLVDQVHLRCATYKNAYNDGAFGWEVEKGFGPSPLGGWWLDLKFDRKGMRFTYTPTD